MYTTHTHTRTHTHTHTRAHTHVPHVCVLCRIHVVKLNAFSQIIWRLHFFQPPSGREKAILEQIISLQFPLLTPSRRAIHYQAEWRWIGLFSFVAVLVITKAIRLFMNLVLVLLSHRGQRLDMNPFCLWRRFCQNYLCTHHNSDVPLCHVTLSSYYLQWNTTRLMVLFCADTNLSEFLHFLPKSGGKTQLPMFLSPLGTFPGSIALWESNCCDLKLFLRHSAPVHDPCFSKW